MVKTLLVVKKEYSPIWAQDFFLHYAISLMMQKKVIPSEKQVLIHLDHSGRSSCSHIPLITYVLHIYIYKYIYIFHGMYMRL